MKTPRARLGWLIIAPLASAGLILSAWSLESRPAQARQAAQTAAQAQGGAQPGAQPGAGRRGAARGQGRRGPAPTAPSPTPDPATPVTITVDASAPKGDPIKPVWQYYGYDECNFTTATNARALMKTLSTINTDPVYLRTHFMLNSGTGYVMHKNGSTNVYTEDAAGKPVYNFRMLDEILDAQVNSGCRPLFELGFMPEALSSNPQPYFKQNPQASGQGWQQPPTDYNKWAGLITEIAKHEKERHPDAEKNWQFELWNEPDIFYWAGGPEGYDKLFDYTEKALHDVMPGAILGGPHAAFYNGNVFRQFLQHCLTGNNAATPGKTGTRLDYIGFHSKGGNRVVEGHPEMNLANNLRTNNGAFNIVASFPQYRNTPIIIGECDPEGVAAFPATTHPENAYRNGPCYAAYEACVIVHTMQIAKQDGVNLKGVLTWAFEFEDAAYYEGYRTLATKGIPKAVLNTYALLSKLKGTEVPMQSSGALGLPYLLGRGGQGFRMAPDVDGIATSDGNGAQVLVWNYHDEMVEGVKPAPVHLSVKAPAGTASAQLTHYRIDDTHSSAFARWKEMGSPQQPSESQIAELKKLAALTTLEAPKTLTTQNGEVSLDFDLPRYGVSLVDLEWIKR